MADKKEEVKSNPEVNPSTNVKPASKAPSKIEISSIAKETFLSNQDYEPEPAIDVKPRTHPKRTVDPKTLLLGLLVAVVIIVAVFAVKQSESVTPPLISPETLEPAPLPVVNYNFSKYLVPNNAFTNANLSVIGNLKHELRPTGKEAFANDYYVVDNYGNKILLSFALAKKSSNFDALFVKEGITYDAFNVTGFYNTDVLNGFKLYVYSINPAR